MSQQVLLFHNSTQRNYSQSIIAKILKADVRVNIDGSNRNTSAISKKEIIERKRTRATNGNIHFMICESCLWCASSLYFNNTDITITECPICDSSRKLDSIPICENENYSFNYDSKSGVLLEFSKS
jgi:hypothetical protein